MIREYIMGGKSVRYMLPDQVIAFIQKNHLYERSEELGSTGDGSKTEDNR